MQRPIREIWKDGMAAETFDTVAWNDVEAAQEGTSKMVKIWYAKQGAQASMEWDTGQANGKGTATPDTQAAEN